MLVLENVGPELINPAAMVLFDTAAAQHIGTHTNRNGWTLGERHIIESEEGPTKSIVWEVVDVRSLA